MIPFGRPSCYQTSGNLWKWSQRYSRTIVWGEYLGHLPHKTVHCDLTLFLAFLSCLFSADSKSNKNPSKFSQAIVIHSHSNKLQFLSYLTFIWWLIAIWWQILTFLCNNYISLQHCLKLEFIASFYLQIPSNPFLISTALHCYFHLNSLFIWGYKHYHWKECRKT